MTASQPDTADEQAVKCFGTEELRLSTWLWRPWYAKLWWTLIPIYWLAMGEPTRPEFLHSFAHSGYAFIGNTIFLPITALLALGAGYIRRALVIGRLMSLDRDVASGMNRSPGLPSPIFDEFNPRSGPNWIGNRARD